MQACIGGQQPNASDLYRFGKPSEARRKRNAHRPDDCDWLHANFPPTQFINSKNSHDQKRAIPTQAKHRLHVQIGNGSKRVYFDGRLGSIVGNASWDPNYYGTPRWMVPDGTLEWRINLTSDSTYLVNPSIIASPNGAKFVVDPAGSTTATVESGGDALRLGAATTTATRSTPRPRCVTASLFRERWRAEPTALR
jgi:hypothetical protein